MEEHDVRNLHIDAMVPDDVYCSKCNGNEYFVSQRSDGTNLYQFPVCKKCDEILVLTSVGIKKVANFRAEEARQESRRQIKIAVIGALITLFVVIPISTAVVVYLLS